MEKRELIKTLSSTLSVYAQRTAMGPDLSAYVRKLERPGKCVDVVIDTDAYNEFDDQFAIAYALKLKEYINIKAFYAAPYTNIHTPMPKTGMERSYDEIHHMLSLAKDENYPVLYGSDAYLPDEHTPVESEAVYDLIERGMAHTTNEPLYVAALAAPTNIASALILEPRLAEHIVVIWHGGTSFDQPMCNSYNALQDIAATRVLMNSGVPMVIQPGKGVADHLSTTGPELEYWLRNKNAVCDYLLERVYEKVNEWQIKGAWSHPIYDVAVFSWFLTDKTYMEDRLESMPLISYDLHYEHVSGRHFVSYVFNMNRDAILTDLFERITQ